MAGNSYLNLNSNVTAEQEAVFEDHRLISGLQAGDAMAYEQLIERFQTPVYNLAYRLLNDQADASDVAQEVFLKIFRNVGIFAVTAVCAPGFTGSRSTSRTTGAAGCSVTAAAKRESTILSRIPTAAKNP